MSRQNIFSVVAILLLQISPLSTAQTPISAQKIVEAIQLNKAYCGCSKVRAVSSRFAEVEILLSEKLSLADISALPTAPGSDLQVLDAPKRVVAQLPDSTVKALRDAGVEITMQKNFILIEGNIDETIQQDGDITILQACSGPSSSGENGSDILIPDYPGVGNAIPAISPIRISNAPTGATTTCIELELVFCHERPRDLVIGLSDEDISAIILFWVRQSAPSGCYRGVVNELREFNGEPVNQRWILSATDFEKGSMGFIDRWWIKVYYAPPPPPGCSGTYSLGENNTDVAIPDDPASPAVSKIDITNAPPGSIVKCIDVHYEVIHTFVGDLEVILTDSDRRPSYQLWDKQGGGADKISETETMISQFNGEPVNQTWILQATDTASGDTGYIDSWWIKVYYEAPIPTNDDCANAIAVQKGVPYKGSTARATGTYESSCGINDKADVWYSYTPTNTGLVKISLTDSTFDTTLDVFDRCAGKELSCNDDLCDDPNSEITMLMTAGATYLIRVAGFDGATGDYTLTVTTGSALLPTKANIPIPANDAANVRTDTILSWSCTIAETSQAQNNGLVTTLSKDNATQEYIFGKDDRIEEFQVIDPNILTAGDATAVLIPRSFLTDNNDGTFTVLGITFAEFYLQLTGRPLCSDEPYRNQPSPGECTAFLVAPDIIATTGHCACPEDCSDRAVVFGFVMLDTYTPALRLGKSEVYYCKEVIARQQGDPDWSLVRLDRNVTGHNPLPLRHSGIVPDNEPLIIIGYPMGVPRKYAAGATVRDNTASSCFQANLDSNIGGSGSPVLSAKTLVVEGVLYAGPIGFVPDGPCDRSFVCPDTGCTDWPNFVYSTRATEFSPLIPLFDVYLGTDYSQLNLLCSDVAVSWCTSGPLKSGTTYLWKVVAKNCYGETSGPIWSFTTVK